MTTSWLPCEGWDAGFPFGPHGLLLDKSVGFATFHQVSSASSLPERSWSMSLLFPYVHATETTGVEVLALGGDDSADVFQASTPHEWEDLIQGRSRLPMWPPIPDLNLVEKGASLPSRSTNSSSLFVFFPQYYCSGERVEVAEMLCSSVVRVDIWASPVSACRLE